jgi:Holliday junction resolvase-like predicted endonuclease
MNLRGLKTGRIGALSELRAQAWLMEQGYEVFKNIKPSGPADLIAWDIKSNTILKIDVKTVRIYIKKDGSKNYNFSSLGNVYLESKNKRAIEGIHYLGYCEEENRFLWFSDSIRTP